MSLRKFSLLISIFGLLLLTSSETKKPKPLFFFNSLKELREIRLSHAPGIYDSAFTLTLTTGKLRKIAIELISDNQVKKVAKSIRIESPSVLRLSYTDEKGQLRHFVGQYTVGQRHPIPVLSLVVEPDAFFPPNGIYVGSMEKGQEEEAVRTIGNAWKKKPITAYAQFFFNGELKEELELDLKTYGGMTLGWKEKSLQLSARKKLHGEGKINVKLFRNLPQREFQHVVLRTSGNDQNKTRFKDLSISQVADELGINTKASRPVVVYVNGIYWGIHNLREKVNKDYFTERYNWKKGDFIELQGSGMYHPGFRKLVSFAAANAGSRDFPKRIADSIDIENFFNFNIIQTYISNADYRGNVRFFKHKHGKWKWVLYDTDLACGNNFLERNFIRDRTFPTEEYWYNPPYATTLLNSLLRNKELKENFVRQYTYLMATYLTPANFHAKLDNNAAIIDGELERHWQRRNHLYSENRTKWNGHVRNLKSYFSRRPESAYKHLMETFSLKAPVQVSVSQNRSGFKGLTMNGSSVRTARINGKFFPELPITLSAVEADHLYAFEKWSDGDKNAERILKPEDGTALKAHYRHLPVSGTKGLIIDKFFVNNDWKDPLLFVSILNTSGENIQLDNFTLYEDVTGSSLALKEKELQPGQSLVLTNDVKGFRTKMGKVNVQVLEFMKGQAFVNDVKFALIENGEAWVDSLQATISDQQLIDHGSYLVTKPNGKLKITHFKMKKLPSLKFNVAIKETPVLVHGNSNWKEFTFVVLIVVGILLSMLLFMKLEKD